MNEKLFGNKNSEVKNEEEMTPVEIFIQRYNSVCNIINNGGINPKIKTINEALVALYNCREEIENIDSYMIRNLMLVATTYASILNQKYITNKNYKEERKKLNENLDKLKSILEREEHLKR